MIGKYEAILLKIQVEDLRLKEDIARYSKLKYKDPELDQVLRKREVEVQKIREEVRQVRRELYRKSA